MIKIKARLFLFVVLILSSCSNELTIEEVIKDKKTPNTKFVVILSPDTGCKGCYSFGYQIGKAFKQESVIITTESFAQEYDETNIVIVDRKTIMNLIPKHFMSMIISIDDSFEPMLISPNTSLGISQKLQKLFPTETPTKNN